MAEVTNPDDAMELDMELQRVRMTIKYGAIDERWDHQDVAYIIRQLDDGRFITVQPLIYTAFISIGGEPRHGYSDRWCYHSVEQAIAAADAWDPLETPEPVGWHRHPSSGRRRPDGDPGREYVAP